MEISLCESVEYCWPSHSFISYFLLYFPIYSFFLAFAVEFGVAAHLVFLLTQGPFLAILLVMQVDVREKFARVWVFLFSASLPSQVCSLSIGNVGG